MSKQLYVMFTALFFLKFIGLILSYAHSNLSSMQLLEMVEKNEINRSLLALLDENIASAQKGNQVGNSNWKSVFHVLIETVTVSGIANIEAT